MLRLILLLLLPAIAEMINDFSELNDSEFNSLSYYELLSIFTMATPEEIKKGYKKAAVKYHPDRNQYPNAATRFIRIAKAYEVLIDSYLRRRYDLDGKVDMDDETSKGLQQELMGDNGIYDNVNEVHTFKSGDFVPSVIHSNDYWLVNFYSPHCSHCLEISSVYRKLAVEFHNVIGFGAVNCFVDNQACAEQGVYGLPSLRLYPKGVVFDETKKEMTFENVKKFVLENSDYQINQFTSDFIKNYTNGNKPTVLMVTNKILKNEDFEKLQKNFITFKWLDIQVGYVNCNESPLKDFCHYIPSTDINHESSSESSNDSSSSIESDNENVKNTIYLSYPNGIDELKNVKILPNMDVSNIMKSFHDIIPKIKMADKEEITNIINESQNSDGTPQTLVVFLKGRSHQSQYEIAKTLKLLQPLVRVVGIDCLKTIFCYDHNIHRFPSVSLIKDTGIEIHYGNFFSREILNFYTLVSATNVSTLSDQTIDSLIQLDSNPNTTFIIYMFDSRSQPCISKMWQFRRFATELVNPSQEISLFTLDCYFNYHICYKYSVTQGFPYVKYKKNNHIELSNDFNTAEDIHEFIKDISIKYVHDLTPESFHTIVMNRNLNHLWFIDYYNSWCSSCQHFLPTFTKLSKKFRGTIYFGKIKCDLYPTFCAEQSVLYYPTLRMFPAAKEGLNNYIEYSGWNHYHLLDQFTHSFLPSAIVPIDPTNFNQLFLSNQTTAWLLDLYALWCGPCMSFMPMLENLAKKMSSDKLKFGKIECSVNQNLCNQFPIQYYPTLLLFPSGNRNKPIRINHSFNDLTRMEYDIIQTLQVKDEL